MYFPEFYILIIVLNNLQSIRSDLLNKSWGVDIEKSAQQVQNALKLIEKETDVSKLEGIAKSAKRLGFREVELAAIKKKIEPCRP